MNEPPSIPVMSMPPMPPPEGHSSFTEKNKFRFSVKQEFRMLALKAALESDKFDLMQKRTEDNSDKPVHEWVLEHADVYYAWLCNEKKQDT